MDDDPAGEVQAPRPLIQPPVPHTQWATVVDECGPEKGEEQKGRKLIRSAKAPMMSAV